MTLNIFKLWFRSVTFVLLRKDTTWAHLYGFGGLREGLEDHTPEDPDSATKIGKRSQTWRSRSKTRLLLCPKVPQLQFSPGAKHIMESVQFSNLENNRFDLFLVLDTIPILVTKSYSI